MALEEPEASLDTFEETIDPEIRPQDDFFTYVNGKWLENTELPSDKARYGSFDVLRDRSRDQVRNILQQDFDDEEFKNVTILFESAMDTDRLDEEDITPIQEYLDKIESIETRDDLITTLVSLSHDYAASVFSFSSRVDRKNSEIEVPHVSAGGLALPSPSWGSNRAYYFDEDKESIRLAYVEYLTTIFQYLGDEKEAATNKAEAVLSLETKLAEPHYTQVEKRDPEKSYHKMTASDLAELLPSFPWNAYFAGFTDVTIEDMVVDNPEFYKVIETLLTQEDISTWKYYLTASVVNGAARYLSSRFEEASFNLYNRTISGVEHMEDRWKRVMNVLNSRFVIGELIGKAYVAEYFPPEAKEQMLELVNNLLLALNDRIKNLSWMSDTTKEKALEKLEAFTVKIGYPDEFEDYSDLKLSKDNSYFENMKQATKYNRDISLERLYKAPDKNKWFMSPQTVNAYYNPSMNEIVFPAGILQFPFFDMDMTPAENYGGIGGVIGHEITHGFDDKGSKFGPTGNMENWWTDEDREAFDERGEYYVEQYNNYLVESSGKPLNGKLTLGENIADHGGVRIAFHALQKHWEKHGKSDTPGDYTPEQLFFMSWGRIWRSLATPELEERQRNSDPHSHNKARVNVTLANVPEFHQYFPTKEGDTMYRDNMVELW